MTSADPIPFSHEFVVDAAYQAHLARALALRAYRTPRLYLLVIGFAMLGLGVTILTPPPSFAGVALLIAAVVLFLVPLLSAPRIRARIGKLMPVGAILASGFGETEFVTSGPDGSTRRLYTALDRVSAEGELVAIRARSTRLDVLYPSELFLPDTFDRFAAAGVHVLGRPNTSRPVGDPNVS